MNQTWLKYGIVYALITIAMTLFLLSNRLQNVDSGIFEFWHNDSIMVLATLKKDQTMAVTSLRWEPDDQLSYSFSGNYGFFLFS